MNHGTVFADLAEDSYALLMTGNNNMLSLLTYPVIQGQISFSNESGSGFGTGNTLLVGSGFDAVFTVGANPDELTVLGQGQPLFVNQSGINQLQVISMSSQDLFRSSSSRMANDLVRFVHQHINTRAIQNRTFLYQDNGLLQDFWFDASGFGQHSTSGANYSHALAPSPSATTGLLKTTVWVAFMAATQSVLSPRKLPHGITPCRRLMRGSITTAVLTVF